MLTPPTHFTPEFEQAFHDDLADEKRRSARECALIASVLYAAFAIIDYYAIPSALNTALCIRFLFVIPILLGVAWASGQPFFLKHYLGLMVLMYFGMGLGIEAMVFLAGADDVARVAYYAGLILVVSALYTWTFLGLKETGTIGFSLVAIYLLIEFFGHNSRISNGWIIILTNGFFFVAANVIGLLAVRIRERNLRALFLAKRAVQEEIAVRKETEKELERLAQTDVLTGLANRRQFLILAESELSRTFRYGGTLTLLAIDIDHFKNVNDTYGHQVGDLVLQNFANTCLGALRDFDAIGRLGGEEFSVILPHTDSAEAQVIAERLRQSVASTERTIEPELPRCTVSIGMVTLVGASATVSSLLAQADHALYEAKNQGRNRVCVFQPVDNIANT